MPGERLPTESRGREKAGECVSDELLFRYLDGAATPEEARVVQKHLLECKTCFDVVAAVTKDSLHVPSEAEWVEFEKTVKPNPEKQIAEIMSRANELFPASSRRVGVKTAEPAVLKSGVLPMQSIGERLRRWFETPQLVPRYVFALSVVILGVLAAFIIYGKIIKKDRYEYYVYDDSVPYEYDMSSLRGTPDLLEQDSLFHSFVNQFKLGMSDYMVRDYEHAIHTFENIESAVTALQTRHDNEKFLPWIRDFYFYLGISHFALSRSQKLELSKVVRRQHANQSIRWLTLADSLVTAYHLAGSERETYFLGMAYGFRGEKTSAVAKLQSIQPGSRFYDESSKLAQEWSKR